MFEPYVAKAIVQHQWTAGTLSIWLTFRFPMNQLVKPLDTVWLVKVDGVVKAVASSAWQDAYTMLLTVSSITTAPLLVAVKFDGPDSNLETTWHKNWEPWGYIVSSYVGFTNQPLNTTDKPTFAGMISNGVIRVNQSNDVDGFQVYGFDDNNAKYLQAYIAAGGGAAFGSNVSMYFSASVGNSEIDFRSHGSGDVLFNYGTGGTGSLVFYGGGSSWPNGVFKCTYQGNLTMAGSLKAGTGFGCNGTAPQTSYSSGGALAAYSTGVYGLSSDAEMAALHALVVKMRAALVANGIMS